MPSYVTESNVEAAALDWFAEIAYSVAHGPMLAPGEPAAERDSYADMVLVGRLRAALARLNPDVPAEARAEALRLLLPPSRPGLLDTNRQVHRWLVDGVPVEVRRPDGSLGGA